MQYVITNIEEKRVSALLDGNQLVQIYAEPVDESSLLGNIYIGKVKNIVKNIAAAFVEISDGIMCYLPLQDVGDAQFTKPKKNNALVVGDELLVQVSKDAIKTKNPSVTTKLQLAGKYVVLTTEDTRISISSKIKDKTQRQALQNLAIAELSETTFGCIMRTNSMDADPTLVLNEISALKNQLEDIVTKGKHRACFSKLYGVLPQYLQNLRDLSEDVVDKVVTDLPEVYQELQAYEKCQNHTSPMQVEYFEEEGVSLQRVYGLQQKIQKLLQERVWLKSGGYLVIQPTEALTVVDVNSGKAINGKKIQSHFLKINKEAAVEIARQIRLRNLSGIIIIDFIDMESPDLQKELLCCLEKEIQKDSVRTVLVDMTKLQLVELTRKKVKKPFHEQWSGVTRKE